MLPWLCVCVIFIYINIYIYIYIYIYMYIYIPESSTEQQLRCVSVGVLGSFCPLFAFIQVYINLLFPIVYISLVTACEPEVYRIWAKKLVGQSSVCSH